MKLEFLELSPDERRLYIEQAAIQRIVSPVIMEKDFWVCWLLDILFQSEFANSLVFKGGTSLKEETGIKDVYLEQFHVFNKPGRDPRGPTITIALFALINSDQCHLIASEDAAKAKWWSAYKIPPLAFDHDEIYANALEALRNALRTRPLAFELLPSEFTLSNLQDLYEQVFGIKLDKRNFRKKLAKMDFLKTSGNKTKGGRRRPALLYSYDPERYSQFAADNLF
jgi:8-oxo-dGTP diphosphatase